MERAYPFRTAAASGATARLRRLLLRHYRLAVFLLDIALFPAIWYAAFELRFGPGIPAPELALFRASLPYLVVLRAVAFYYRGVHRGSWRHVSMSDLASLLQAVTASALALYGLSFVVPELAGLSLRVLLLDLLLAVGVFGGARFAVRGVREFLKRRRRQTVAPGKRALIVGSAEAAEQLLRELGHSGGSDFVPIGIVDDMPGRREMRIHGVRIVGTTSDLGRLVRRLDPDLLVIAVLSSTGENMRRLLDRCRSTGVQIRIMPSVREISAGQARAGQVREIRTEDLLGREVIALDLRRVREQIAGRRVLITGGAGSIGFELARQVADHGPERLILLDQAETPLYFSQLELKDRARCEVVAVVGNISDRGRVREVFEEHQPHLVFHAAAYKHVPMMEANVVEAIRVNVLGTQCVAEAAVEFGVDRFVLISTDKAVNPSCVMGATKRVAERIALGLPRTRFGRTDFRAVRFGNVLGSNGSVIPVFDRQLAEGGALTVTHPEVTRYFMTIPEAVQLVLQAATLPEAAGQICMLDMGEPIRILELAEAMIRNAGLRPYKDVPIEFTGLRPGEKLHEELMSNLEQTLPTSVEKVRIVHFTESEPDRIQEVLDGLAGAIRRSASETYLYSLTELVPECVEPLRSLAGRAPAPAQRRVTNRRGAWPAPMQRAVPILVDGPSPAATIVEDRTE